MLAGVESPHVRKVFDAIRVRGDQPSPLYRILAHSPSLLESWAAFAGALRTATSIDRATFELVVMRLAQMSNAPYQWAYHWKPAISAGITEPQLHALESWRRAGPFDERQQAVLSYAESIFEGSVSDEDVETLKSLFSSQGIVELTVIIGFYITVGRVLQALEVEVDESRAPYLP